MTIRHYTPIDRFCLGFDQALRAICGNLVTTSRSFPAEHVEESELTPEQIKHSAGIMRINHAGEVCAQALYQAQGLASRCKEVRDKMERAAIEEGDHLAWCSLRLSELGSHTSYFNPFWYMGSFAIGLTAGLVGDKWSLGFLAETEKQVVNHLSKQMQLLPSQDARSYTILEQMQADELQHQNDAIDAGAAELPSFIKKIMSLTSKVMVKVAYWV